MRPIKKSTNIVEVSNVTFSYGSASILRRISFSIHQGDYLGIVGPNGAGKTTLLKIMLGLLIPESGTVRLFGQPLDKFRQWPLIGYVPQQTTTHDIMFPITVQEAVLMGTYGKRGIAQFSTQDDWDRANEVLREVDLYEQRHRLFGSLSGGEAQRTLIARALVNHPHILFLDEPTTGVDLKAQKNFYSFLRVLNREKNITIVLVSHDISMVTKEVSQIACINKTLVCHASPKEFLKESRTAKLFGESVKIITHHHHDPLT